MLSALDFYRAAATRRVKVPKEKCHAQRKKSKYDDL